LCVPFDFKCAWREPKRCYLSEIRFFKTANSQGKLGSVPKIMTKKVENKTVKHENKTLQISANLDPRSFAVSRQIQEELQATIAEAKDAVERSRSLIENSNKLLAKKRSA
jgi:EAL domain-containing protein (putative c-di-GMP-specific phosphodiesterase class I)